MLQPDKLEKLIKLLNLTTSSEEHEALSSIRFANKLLQKNGLTWSKLLSGISGKKYDYEYGGRKYNEPQDDADILEMLRQVRIYAWAGFDFTFIDSLEDKYDKYGKLTPKQYEALRKVHAAVMRK